MASEGVERLFARKGIWRSSELRAEGVQFRDLRDAVEAGVVVRPIFNRRVGPVHGVFVSRDLDRDPERGMIVGALVTDGVIGRHSAAFRYGLSTDLPRATELHVRANYSRVPVQIPLLIMRSRNEDMRRIGVDHVDTEFGVSIPITTPARTVVDILHSGRLVSRDYEHGLDAIEAFLQAGGEPGEITNMAHGLGLDPDGRIELLVGAVHRGMGARRMGC